MKLQILIKGAWRIVSPIQENAGDMSCALLEQLADLPSAYHRSAHGFYAIWEQIGTRGPNCLPTNMYHCVDSNNKIYEFIKGDLRVLCFVAKNQICVCSTVFIKSGRKPRKPDIRAAIALRNQYLIEEQAGMHEFIEGE